MKKRFFDVIAGCLMLAWLLGFARSDSYGQQLKQIGTFTEAGYPVYHLGYNLQSTPDGNFLMFRGGNFQRYSSVKSFEGVPDFSNWNGLHTDAAGLTLPPSDQLPEIPGWEVCYCYDVVWNVTGYGLCKDGIDFSAYKDDPNLRLFKTAKAAEKQVVTKPATGPVGPIPSTGSGTGGSGTASTGSPTGANSNAGYFNPDFPNYDLIPGTQVLSDWWKGWVGFTYAGPDYWDLLEELPGGEAHFEFYGQGGVNYPAPRVTNTGPSASSGAGLVQLDLPTHSTTTEWDAVLKYKTRSKVRMELYDQFGNLVWRLFDTKGGFHPLNTGWQPRGNNHSSGLRWIVPGVYTMKFWNLNSPDDAGVQTQRFEFIKSQNWQIKELVGPGEYKEFILDMSDGNAGFKTNCNLTKSLN